MVFLYYVKEKISEHVWECVFFLYSDIYLSLCRCALSTRVCSGSFFLLIVVGLFVILQLLFYFFLGIYLVSPIGCIEYSKFYNKLIVDGNATERRVFGSFHIHLILISAKKKSMVTIATASYKPLTFHIIIASEYRVNIKYYS